MPNAEAARYELRACYDTLEQEILFACLILTGVIATEIYF